MTTLTRTGVIVGTPGYMSPEQFEGRGVDERTDVYSLGIVLFELLTGRLPFTGRTPLAVAMKHKSEPPPAPRSLKVEIPAWLERVCLRCLEKDPASRFGSAAELARALRRPRAAQGEKRRLRTGDFVADADEDPGDWALILESVTEKSGWSSGMALRFEARYYKLEAISPPPLGAEHWRYRFLAWPEGQVFRRLVDYEEDCAARSAQAPHSLSRKLRKWISGR
jgi:serine/threonine protein kinase